MTDTKKITKIAAFIAVAVILGYVESLFPPIAAGVKLGIANIVIITVLYTHSARETWIVAVLKVVLCMALFGSMTSFIYSISGAVLNNHSLPKISLPLLTISCAAIPVNTPQRIPEMHSTGK